MSLEGRLLPPGAHHRLGVSRDVHGLREELLGTYYHTLLPRSSGGRSLGKIGIETYQLGHY
jgi:hypothetical protein